MKKLVLVRHAKAEQIYSAQDFDFNRPLLARGISDAENIASKLLDLDIIPDQIISSSAERAKQTAQVMARTLKPDNKIDYQQFIYEGYTTADMLKFISEQDNDKDTLMIVGHNPDIASITCNLLTENLYEFPTGFATAIEFDCNAWYKLQARSGKLLAHLYPKLLK